MLYPVFRYETRNSLVKTQERFLTVPEYRRNNNSRKRDKLLQHTIALGVNALRAQFLPAFKQCLKRTQEQRFAKTSWPCQGNRLAPAYKPLYHPGFINVEIVILPQLLKRLDSYG
jgi:hypothetical protein